MTVRIGLIGCGRIAERHIRTIAAMKQLSLAAVSDIAEERMRAAAAVYLSLRSEGAGVRQIKAYRELIRDPGVDAVVVATLSGLHAEVALEAIAAGKPVMVEKPLSLSLRDADRIIACSAQRGVPVLVCHQLRYRPLFAKLKRCLRQGGLGRVLYGSVSLRIRRDRAYYAAAPWRGNWERDGGMLVNQGIHLLDLLLWYLGDAEQINGHLLRIPDSGKETEDAAVATIRFADGAAGVLDANTVSLPANLEQSIYLFGDNGTAAIGGEALNRIVRWEVSGMDAAEAAGLLADTSERRRMYEDFVRAVEQGGEPLANAAEGKRALELIFALYQSHLERRPVLLPAGDFSPLAFRKSEGWNG